MEENKADKRFKKVEKLIAKTESNKKEMENENPIFPSLEYAPLPPGNLSVANYEVPPQNKK